MRISNRIFFAGVISATLLLPIGATADQIRGYVTASLLPTAVDTNNDGINASAIDGSGKLSPFGKFTIVGRGEGLPWDFTSFCSPSEIKIKFQAHNGVFTFKNGDQFFYVLDADNPDNEFCVNIVDGSSRGTTNYVIVGGTGRFTGASGSFSLEGKGTAIFNLKGMQIGGVAEGPLKGEVTLAHSFDDDDYDDHD